MSSSSESDARRTRRQKKKAQRPPTVQTAEERARRRRRNWLLWGTSPISLALLVLGMILMINTGVTRTAMAEYADDEIYDAIDGFEYLDSVNPVERWKAPFNLGTAKYVAESLWGAREPLDRALELVPQEHRCMVQTNRALVYEGFGDQEMEWSVESAGWAEEAQALVDADEDYPDDAPWGTATPEELADDARRYAGWAESDYAIAAEARADPACADDQQASAEQQEQNEESQERLEEKQQSATEAAQDPAEEPAPQPGTPEQEEAGRQEELEQRNAEAGAEAEAERQEQAGGGGGGPDEGDEEGGAGGGAEGEGDEEGSGGGTKGW